MKLWQLFSLGRRALLLAEQVAQRGSGQHVIAFDDRVGKALAEGGHRVTRLEGEQPFPGEELVDGICFDALGDAKEPLDRLRASLRAVRAGGYVLSATPSPLGGDHAAAAKLAATFLHAGLVELRQETRRGLLLTSGRVRRGTT